MMGVHLRITLRLSARYRMALACGHLLPRIFLLSFLVLYRSEDPLLSALTYSFISQPLRS
jgi:hypothetical protein